jgi:RimJ/RimL family protein N-acetyltransferase
MREELLLCFEEIRPLLIDQENLWKLKSELHDVYWSGYMTAPDPEVFRNWYAEQLKRKDRKILLAKSMRDKTIIVGYLYLTIEQNTVLLSHGVSRAYEGQGVGTKIINFATNFCLNTYKEYTIEAWIVEDNIASIKTFLKNGFVATPKTIVKHYASMGKDVLLKNYSYPKI